MTVFFNQEDNFLAIPQSLETEDLNPNLSEYEYLSEHMPGAVARSEACPFGMQAAPSSIPTSGTFFPGDLVMKTFLRPFSLFR